LIPITFIPRARGGRAAFAPRSAADPTRVFCQEAHGSYAFARGGAVCRPRPQMAQLLLFLAANPAVYVSVDEVTDALWGDREDGGPLDTVRNLHVLRSLHKRELATLGLRLFSRNLRGLELVLLPLGAAPAVTFRGSAAGARDWVDRAAALRLAGVSWQAIKKQVGTDLHHSSMAAVVRLEHPYLNDMPRQRPASAKGGLLTASYRDPGDLRTPPQKLARNRAWREKRRHAARSTHASTVHSVS
jgi:hypothetical protein